MAVITTNTNNGNDYVKYLEKKLLHQVFPILKLAQFAMMEKLPTGQGNKTVSFFRRSIASSGNVQILTEGAPISTFTNITLTEVPVTLYQYGEAVRISDLNSELSRFKQNEISVEILGQDLAWKVDDTARNEIVTNATQNKYAGGNTSFSGLSAATSAPIAYSDIISSRTSLRINNVPFYGDGDFIALLPSIVYHDLFKDTTVQQILRYPPESERLFNGELGEIANIKLIEVGNPFIESSTQGTYDPSGGIYSTIVFGRDAYGMVDMASQSSMKPRIMVVDKPDSNNPLGQYETIGYKAYFNAKLLNNQFVTVIRSKTSYV